MLDILESKKVKIRKSCFCWGCGREFTKGHTLRKVTTVDCGVFSHTKWCNVCDEYWNVYMENGEEIGFGDLRSQDKEGWQEIMNSF